MHHPRQFGELDIQNLQRGGAAGEEKNKQYKSHEEETVQRVGMFFAERERRKDGEQERGKGRGREEAERKNEGKRKRERKRQKI